MDMIQSDDAKFLEHVDNKSKKSNESSGSTDVSLDLAWDDPWRLSWVQKLALKDETLYFLNEIAKKELKYPVMAVSWIDESSQRFQYKGQTVSLPRHKSLCGYVVASKEPLIVLDTLEDDRFKNHPLVTGKGNSPFDGPIRFLASAPICHDGYVLGTMFAADYAPHHPSPEDMKFLTSHMHALASTAVIIVEGSFADFKEDEPEVKPKSFWQWIACGCW
ncbi:hypothetical protein THRCLA_08318 [Thraustotheca clavata]|uniref:GAF domain-containing protein n=1 Tax=Thraustotheca clavata TaxID=74557 RepID=A0A1V9Z7B9_9STRA|nr:hypothetical protein THRCLA_08318 [Thraustotheca clavata]